MAISHYSFIANIIQLAVHNKVNEDYCPWDARRFRPGDVVNGGPSVFVLRFIARSDRFTILYYSVTIIP